MPVSDAMLKSMMTTNPLAEKMLDQRDVIRGQTRSIIRLQGELEGSERTVRNLQHELDVVRAENARLKSGGKA